MRNFAMVSSLYRASSLASKIAVVFIATTLAIISHPTCYAATWVYAMSANANINAPQEDSEVLDERTEIVVIEETLSVDRSENFVDFHRDILPLLRSRCLSCHQGENPKGGFLALDRETVQGYLSPGDSVGSSLWTDYLNQPSKNQNPESAIMPPDGPLSSPELALFKLWMDEGAYWPENAPAQNADDSSANIQGNAATTNEHSSDAISDASELAKSTGKRIYKASGYLHPALVHFPVALIVLAGGCAFISYFLGARCQSMAFHLLWLGALSCIAASAAGWSFAETRGYTEWRQFPPADASPEVHAAFIHRWVGIATSVLSVLTTIIGLMAFRYKSRWLGNAWRILAMILALLVSYVGHKGGELVYGDIFIKIREILFG